MYWDNAPAVVSRIDLPAVLAVSYAEVVPRLTIQNRATVVTIRFELHLPVDHADGTVTITAPVGFTFREFCHVEGVLPVDVNCRAAAEVVAYLLIKRERNPMFEMYEQTDHASRRFHRETQERARRGCVFVQFNCDVGEL